MAASTSVMSVRANDGAASRSNQSATESPKSATTVGAGGSVVGVVVGDASDWSTGVDEPMTLDATVVVGGVLVAPTATITSGSLERRTTCGVGTSATTTAATVTKPTAAPRRYTEGIASTRPVRIGRSIA